MSHRANSEPAQSGLHVLVFGLIAGGIVAFLLGRFGPAITSFFGG